MSESSRRANLQHELTLVNNQTSSSTSTSTSSLSSQTQNPDSLKDSHELFLAIMSHELRTPLNSLIGMSRLLQDPSQQHNLTDKQKQQIDVMYKCSFEMMSLMNDVMDYSLMKLGQVKIHMSCFSVHELIETALDIVGLRLQEKRLQVKYDYISDISDISDISGISDISDLSSSQSIDLSSNLSGSTKLEEKLSNLSNSSKYGLSDQSNQSNQLPNFNSTNSTKSASAVSVNSSRPTFVSTSSSVFGDGKRIKQILVNLLTNAIKFTSFGFINILFRLKRHHSSTSSMNQQQCQFMLYGQVQDSGVGIPRDMHLRIFDDFFTSQQQQQQPFLSGSSGSSGSYGSSGSSGLSSIYVGNNSNNSSVSIPTGVGLGLSICRKLTELMGGHIRVIQSDVNQGTTIGFEVPVFAGFSDVFLEYTKDKKIMVVESDISRKFAFTELLTELETVAFGCSSVTEARHFLQRYPQLVEIIMSSDTLIFSDLQKLAVSQTRPLIEYIKPPVHIYDILSTWYDYYTKFIEQAQIKPLLSLTKSHYHSLQKKPDDCRILVVEDNLYNQQTLLQLLFHLQYDSHHIDVACSGMEALQKVSQHNYDVVFMDLRLPQWDGYETTQKIRYYCHQMNKQQPIVIAATAYVTNIQQQKCIESGMQGFLKKPILLEQLFQVMNVIHQRKKIAMIPQSVLQPLLIPSSHSRFG